MDDGSEPLEIVYRSTKERVCREYALVLRAAGIDHEILRRGKERMLVVAAEDAQRARAELDAYVAENREWPAKSTVLPFRTRGLGGAMGYVAVLALATMLRYRHGFGLDWYRAGKAHAGLMRDGEWWRAVTALTLHVDLGHLLANLVIGGLVVMIACQLLGNGVASLSILLAGAVGNALNAIIRQPDQASVGASTAVFAALGIVAAYVWQQRRAARLTRLQRWAPLVGGVVLLTYLGAGDERTDVVAHVTGFVSGIALGAALGRLGERVTFGAKSESFYGLAALMVLAASWALALTR